MSSFPDVLSTELSYQAVNPNNKQTFTVPAEYAFAVVQVCFIPQDNTTTGTFVSTSHGSFNFDNHNANDGNLKDLPILNLIIKGGESFSLISYKFAGSTSGSAGLIKAKVTALCHKKPS